MGTWGVSDLKRVTVAAVALIVVLRLAIGWQFVYEGLWKYNSLESPNPWTAEGYLKQAQGPFRQQFRAMTGDPDDLGWLDLKTMEQRWANWRQRFVSHYQLDEAQQKELATLLDPPGPAAVALASLPATVDLKKVKNGPVTFDASHKQLVATNRLLPEEADTLKRMVNVVEVGGVFAKRGEDGQPVREGASPVPAAESDIALYKGIVELSSSIADPKQTQRLNQLKAVTGIVPQGETFVRVDDNGVPLTTGGQLVEADAVDVAFYKAVVALEKKANALSYSQRLTALLSADPDRVGVIYRTTPKSELAMGTAPVGSSTEFNVKYGDIQAYKDLIQEYEAALAEAQVNFQFDHVDRIGKKLAAKRSEVVGPVRALDADMKKAASKLLKPAQFSQGALPPEDTPLHRASSRAMWGLLILGALLLLGLGTRLAALAGAVMLLSFYLVLPPWPGVPQPPSPEHSFIVNKNLIEVIALLAIAALPTGSWFGLDGLIRKLFLHSDPVPNQPKNVPLVTPAKA